MALLVDMTQRVDIKYGYNDPGCLTVRRLVNIDDI